MLTLAACSDEMTNAEVRTAAEGMGMVMAGSEAMNPEQVMEAAKGMGMMTEEEAKAMMPEPAMMGGDRLAQVKGRGKVICASRNDVPGYGSIDSSRQQRRLRHRPLPRTGGGRSRRSERH